MLKADFTLKSTVVAANAAIVVTSINRHQSSTETERSIVVPTMIDDPNNPGNQISAQKREIEQVPATPTDKVHYSVSVFASVEAYKNGTDAAERLNDNATHNHFTFNYEDIEGSTLREKCYNHLLTLEPFTTAIIIDGEEA